MFLQPGPIPATDAGLDLPSGVAVDTNGNVFIADTYDEFVEKVDTNGMIQIVAGHGILEGFSGDGGAATNAQLTRPKGVAVSPAQDLYISDTLNERIRLVDSNGIITTIAGNGNGYPNGAYGGDGGAATNASSYNPIATIIDPSGNMYVVESSNNRIRLVPYGGFPRLVLPDVTLTNTGNYSVVVTDSSGSVTSRIASLTVLLPPSINVEPVSQSVPIGGSCTLEVDATGTAPLHYQWSFNEMVLDGQTNSMLSLPGVGTNEAGAYQVVITNFYGSVTSTVASIVAGYPPEISRQPANQTVPAGGSLSFDTSAAGTGPFAYQWQHDGTNLPANVIMTVAGTGTAGLSGDGGAATNANLNRPASVTCDVAGDLLIADYGNNRVRKVSLYASYATLRLHNAEPDDGGNYRLILTSPFGSVTSLVATLTVVLPPQSFSIADVPSGVRLQFSGTPEYAYIMLSTTNLAQACVCGDKPSPPLPVQFMQNLQFRYR